MSPYNKLIRAGNKCRFRVERRFIGNKATSIDVSLEAKPPLGLKSDRYIVIACLNIRSTVAGKVIKAMSEALGGVIGSRATLPEPVPPMTKNAALARERSMENLILPTTADDQEPRPSQRGDGQARTEDHRGDGRQVRPTHAVHLSFEETEHEDDQAEPVPQSTSSPDVQPGRRRAQSARALAPLASYAQHVTVKTTHNTEIINMRKSITTLALLALAACTSHAGAPITTGSGWTADMICNDTCTAQQSCGVFPADQLDGCITTCDGQSGGAGTPVSDALYACSEGCLGGDCASMISCIAACPR